jgi:hypothetical protein
MHFELADETVRRWIRLRSHDRAQSGIPKQSPNVPEITMNKPSSCRSRSRAQVWQSGGNEGFLSRRSAVASVRTGAAGDNGRLQQCQGDFGSWFRTLIVTAAIAGLQTACGGLPQTPNIREEISTGMKGLGVVPFYPLQETARIGELRLVDVERANLTDVPSYLPTNVLLSDDLVPAFESARQNTMKMIGRFPKSPSDLQKELAPSGDTMAFYQQSTGPTAPANQGTGSTPAATAAAPAAPGAPAPVKKSPAAPKKAAAAPAAVASDPPAAAAVPATPPAAPGAPAPVKKPPVAAKKAPAVTKKKPAAANKPSPGGVNPPQSQDLPALSLAGLASYKLASADELQATWFVPSLWQSFLGSFGLRNTSSLEIEAEGVEIAELPLDQVLKTLRQACLDPNSVLGTEQIDLLLYAYRMLANYNQQLQKSVGHGVPSISPEIYLLRRIYYLRGIRYIWKDSRTTAALLEAARNTAPQPTAPPTINTVTIANTPPTTTASAATSIGSEVQAQLDALKAEQAAQAKALSSGTNAQFALSYAAATARGIELVTAFDRPLAFGYEALGWNWNPLTDKNPYDKGLRKLCP